MMQRFTKVCAVAGLATCDATTCAGVPLPEPKIQCCAPHSGGPRCESRTNTECTTLGGSNIGTGSCPAVNPCH